LKKKPANEALQEASALFVADRLEEAKRACRKLLAKRPDIAEGHVLLGEIHRQSGDEARARECHARALKLRPEWSEAHVPLTMGNLFGDYGRYLEAEGCYRRALELQPDLAEARYNLAAASECLGAASRGARRAAGVAAYRTRCIRRPLAVAETLV
jgi:tetratricopeptide (TPR) repeat protein